MKVLVLGHNNYHGDLGNITMYNFSTHFENLNSVLVNCVSTPLSTSILGNKITKDGQASIQFINEKVFLNNFECCHVIFDHLRKILDFI